MELRLSLGRAEERAADEARSHTLAIRNFEAERDRYVRMIRDLAWFPASGHGGAENEAVGVGGAGAEAAEPGASLEWAAFEAGLAARRRLEADLRALRTELAAAHATASGHQRLIADLTEVRGAVV